MPKPKPVDITIALRKEVNNILFGMMDQPSFTGFWNIVKIGYQMTDDQVNSLSNSEIMEYAKAVTDKCDKKKSKKSS